MRASSSRGRPPPTQVTKLVLVLRTCPASSAVNILQSGVCCTLATTDMQMNACDRDFHAIPGRQHRLDSTLIRLLLALLQRIAALVLASRHP